MKMHIYLLNASHPNPPTVDLEYVLSAKCKSIFVYGIAETVFCGLKYKLIHTVHALFMRRNSSFQSRLVVWCQNLERFLPTVFFSFLGISVSIRLEYRAIILLISNAYRVNRF